MSPPPWMPFYIRDYLADTAHLSTPQHGAYLLLMMHYWQHSGLPSDDKILARIARVSDRQWMAYKPVIIRFFDSNWHHNRLSKELAKATAKVVARASAGHLGGIAKASKSHPVANNLPEQNSSNALASSSDKRDSSLRSESSPAPPASEPPPSWKNLSIDPPPKGQPASGVETDPSPASGEPPDEPKIMPPSIKSIGRAVAVAPTRSAIAKRGTRLPADFLPDEGVIELGVSLGLSRDAVVGITLDGFRDYWAAVAGQKGVKLDWQATYRNWLRRESTGFRGRAPPRREAPPNPGFEAGRRGMARLLEREREKANGREIKDFDDYSIAIDGEVGPSPTFVRPGGSASRFGRE